MADQKVAVGSDEWRTLRKKYVGGSEVAALFGVHPNVSEFQLYHYKIGSLAEPNLMEQDYVFWGTVLEPAVAHGWSIRSGVPIRKADGYYIHESVPMLAASLDYIATYDDGIEEILEIKTVDAFAANHWKDEDGEIRPPVNYELQLQQQMECSGIRRGRIVALIGGNRMKEWSYEYMPPVAKAIRERVTAFAKRIEMRDEPDPDWSADGDVIRQLYQRTVDDTVDMSGNRTLEVAVGAYLDWGQKEKEAKKEKEKAHAQLLYEIGHTARVTGSGWKINSYTVAETEIKYTREPYRVVRVVREKAGE